MTLRVSVDGPVATITIDNPGKRNAMSADMWRSVPGILSQLRGVPVVVLTGAGNTFCAGADIGSLQEIGTDTAGANLAVAAEEALAAFPGVTIARVAGDCVGGGCQLALACDLRLAAPDARFGITPARLGVVYPVSSTRRLVQIAGLATATWLLLSASLIPASQALEAGLVHFVDAGLDERVPAVAQILASRSALSQAAMKEILAMVASGVVNEHRVEQWMRQVRVSGEAAEGAAAFLERRAPRFPWRPHA